MSPRRKRGYIKYLCSMYLAPQQYTQVEECLLQGRRPMERSWALAASHSTLPNTQFSAHKSLSPPHPFFLFSHHHHHLLHHHLCPPTPLFANNCALSDKHLCDVCALCSRALACRKNAAGCGGWGDWRSRARSSIPRPRLPRRRMRAKAEMSEVGAEEMEWDENSYKALLSGGEEVVSVMKEVADLLDDIAGMDNEGEHAALEMAVAGTIGQRLDKLDGSFLMALEWMMSEAQKDDDKKKVELLQMIKDAVLSQLTKKFPSHVQVVSMLCTTSSQEHRQRILRYSAGGGGTYETENGGKLLIPKANLNDIANQADDVLLTIEEKPTIKDRRLLAKLVLIREEARSMMGGGLLDDRNDNRGLKNLPEPEVTFLSKLVAIRPGPLLRERIANVMNGKDEGADRLRGPNKAAEQQFESYNPKNTSLKQMLRAKRCAAALPVRPGVFLDTITKVMAGLYKTGGSGVTVQHLEWVHKETLKILQEIAFV